MRAVVIGAAGLAPLALVALFTRTAVPETRVLVLGSFVLAAALSGALARRLPSALGSLLAPRHGGLALVTMGVAALGPAGLAAAAIASTAWVAAHRSALVVEAGALAPREARTALGLLALAAAIGGGPAALWAAPLALDAPMILEDPIWSGTSRFQRLLVTRARGAVRLWLDGQLQLESGDEAAYHETLVHPALAASSSAARVLVLGGGDGLVVRELLRDARVREIVVVDIDRAVTSLARRLPALRSIGGYALDDPRVRLVHADALVWAPAAVARGERFDVVVGDLPDPSSEVLAPLFARETIATIATLLGPGGVFALQAGAPRATPWAFASIVGTVSAAGLETTALAFDEPIAFGGTAVVLGAREAPPRPGPLHVTTAWLTAERLAAAGIRAPLPPARITTLAEPAVLGYLRRAMRAPERWTSP